MTDTPYTTDRTALDITTDLRRVDREWKSAKTVEALHDAQARFARLYDELVVHTGRSYANQFAEDLMFGTHNARRPA